MGAILAGLGVGASLGAGIIRARASRLAADAEEDAAQFRIRQILQASTAEQARLRRQARRTISSQSVAFAKAGVTLEGSPLELLSQNAAELEADAVNVGRAARTNVALERARAANARAAGDFGVGTSLLTGLVGAAKIGIPTLGQQIRRSS